MKNLLVGIVALFAVVALWGATRTPQTAYGGDPAMYARIRSETDTARLDRMFWMADRAYKTEGRSELVGYQMAITERLKELGR